MKTRYLMCAGGLVSQGDKVQLKNGKFLFWQKYLDFFVTDIFDDRVKGRTEKTGEMISIPRGDFIILVKRSDVASARIQDELDKLHEDNGKF